MKPVLCLQGPSLNLLGRREPEVYGTASLPQIQGQMDREAERLGLVLHHHQDNHEGGLIDRIQQGMDQGIQGIVINPGAYGHTSVALRDALVGAEVPFVEVHLSNVYGRESFRHKSLLAGKAAGVIVGFGPLGYSLALRGIADRIGA